MQQCCETEAVPPGSTGRVHGHASWILLLWVIALHPAARSEQRQLSRRRQQKMARPRPMPVDESAAEQ